VAEQVPSDLRYTAEHEWIRVEGELLHVGITDYAQEQLGDVVYVDLPGPGAEVQAGQPFGEVESTKSVSDLCAPASGSGEARNDALDERPELVNSDPYGEGWLVIIRASDPSAVEGFMDAAAYQDLLPG
jgi:glycine cleavage system H protein